MTLSDQDRRLARAAKKAQNFAYAPYSKFKVGAAVLTEGGKIFTGCNVENASYGLTNCAERVAIAKAVSEGRNKFRAIAIATNSKRPTAPCGACRQVIFEFGSDILVIMAGSANKISSRKISELLPDAFGPKQLKK